MSDLPSLGPRGEGWVAIQGVILTWIAATGWYFPAGVVAGLPPLVGVAGWTFIAAGLALVLAGTQALASHDAFTALPRPRDSARLVETGAFRLVRNPVYGGLVLIGLGWAATRGSIAALAGTAVLFVFLDLKRRREEAWLAERFPGYAAYRSRTRRMIPWIY